MAIHARRALLEEGWARSVRVTFDGSRIEAVATGTAVRPGDVRVDTLLPAPGNLHSHAFQRAMAGMTERRTAGRDSFWTWRATMYAFLDRLSPEQVEAIAAQVFVEMLEAGYVAVGEFHYVHHQPGGRPYDDLAELSGRICAAAAETGIGLTLLPVLYTHGGAERAPLKGGQRRFGNDPERFARLVDGARRHLATLPADARIGVAPHSLRATCPDDLATLLDAFPEGPVHIHAAEQVREVEEISAWLGARPVEWLLGEAGAGERWCIVHATHMTAREAHDLAASGAVAGLCPITEASLGDGIFDGARFLRAGGTFGIGSDSNVRIALGEELRMLEYSQRLRDRGRAILAPDGVSVGASLYRGALGGASRALNRNGDAIAPGKLADLLAIDGEGPALCALPDDRTLDGLVFAAGEGVVRDVWSAGRHVVTGGRHHAREAVAQRYRKAVASLLG